MTARADLRAPVHETDGGAAPTGGATPFLEPLVAEDEGSASALEMLRVALDSLIANKTRALLTALGVIIGVLAVVTLLSLGEGVTASVTGQLQSMGTNTLFVQPGFSNRDNPMVDTGARPVLTMDDAEALAALSLPMTGLAPQSSTSGRIVAPAANTDATIIGTTPDYLTVSNLKMAAGVFFSEEQSRSASPVIVLGADLKETLFGTGEAVGQMVRVKDQPLRVVGVLEAQGGFSSSDGSGIVPITLLQQRLGGSRSPDGNSYVVSTITLSARRPVRHPGDRGAHQRRCYASAIISTWTAAKTTSSSTTWRPSSSRRRASSAP